MGRLKIEKELTETERLDAEIEKLEEKRKAIQERLEKKLPFEKSRRNYCGGRKSLCEAIEDIKSEVHLSVMAKDKSGRAVQEVARKYLEKRQQLEKCVTREDVSTQGILS